MKWNQSKSSRNCANQPLAELIRDELDEKQCEQLAAHLDDCETCQQRLTSLAGESHWWLDAGRWLDPAVADMESYDVALEEDTFACEDSHYPNAEEELLASGLLEASEKDGLIGTLGRYEVQSMIGAGGTGIVLKAMDVELNRTVAIKVLSPALAASGAARRRFAREGQAVAAVAHENVVAVHHVEAGGRLPYLVMQYIDGDSLQDLVVREGPLDVTTALRMTAQLASALSAAHDQGLVHRDVKPANILVGAAGQRVWITDFGLARAVDDASLTRTGFIAGTPHYMFPEQARGEAVRASSDLFGLGSVLYFVLTGRPPFRAERSTVVPATAETDVDSLSYGAALALTEESPTAPWRDEAATATFDATSVSPQSPPDPISPEPAPSSLPQPTDSEAAAFDEESLVWNTSLKELRASFRLLETQVAQPPGAELIDGGSVSPPASDSFDYELRRMENSLRMLESRPVDMIYVQPSLKTHIQNTHGG